jgi:hypothetical protein
MLEQAMAEASNGVIETVSQPGGDNPHCANHEAPDPAEPAEDVQDSR